MGIQGGKVCVGAKKGGGKQKLSWLDVLRHKSEQSKQRRKPEATPSQVAGMRTYSPVWLANGMAPIIFRPLARVCCHVPVCSHALTSSAVSPCSHTSCLGNALTDSLLIVAGVKIYVNLLHLCSPQNST